MKTLKIFLSNNGWEYQSTVILTYKDKYETKKTLEYACDSEGNSAPNEVILDGEYIITFDEGFEIQGE